MAAAAFGISPTLYPQFDPTLPGTLDLTFTYGPCVPSIPCDTFVYTFAFTTPASYGNFLFVSLTPLVPVTNAAEPPYVSFQSYRFTNGDFVLSGAPAYTRFSATPEPSTLALASAGVLAGLGAMRRRRRAEA